MKIKMLRNAAKSIGCELLEGETGEVEESLAKQLVSDGIAAKAVSGQEVRGVPEPASVSVARPVEISAEDETKDSPAKPAESVVKSKKRHINKPKN